MTRPMDWVDRLAGFRPVITFPDGERFVADGPWLGWPMWRRLLDLARLTFYAKPIARLDALVYRWWTYPRDHRRILPPEEYYPLALERRGVEAWAFREEQTDPPA